MQTGFPGMKLSALILLLFVSTSALAGSIAIDKDFRNIPLGPRLEYLIDPAGTLTIDDIRNSSRHDRNAPPLRWIRSDRDSLGFGFTSSAYWVRLRVKNNTAGEVTSYLNQNYPLISYIDCHIDDGKVVTSVRTGHSYRFPQRPLNYRTFVFPIRLKPDQEVTCYLRFRTESTLIIDLDLYAPAIFKLKDDQESAFLWMFYGILLVMLLYHLILFFSVKDIGYLYYILSIAAMLFLVMGLTGTSYQHLWPDNPWWEKNNNPVMIGFTYAFFLLFGRYYVGLQRQMPRSDIVLKALVIMGLATGLSTLIIKNYRISIISTTFVTLVSMFYSIYILLVLTFVKKSREARSFLTAVSILMLGVILYILKTYGLIPETFITNYSMQAGWVAMVILLSLGLADRINAMRLQIEETQKKYIHLLESSNDIIFNLDENYRFATINMAIKKHLGYEPSEVLNTGILDFINRKMDKDSDMYRTIFEEYLSGLKKNKDTITFRTDFRPKYGSEPVTLSVKLDYVESDGKAGIFGTASPVTDDIILNLMDTERQVFFTDNSFSHAELLSQRLVKNLGKHLDPAVMQSVRIALMEVLINAIEHGNLDIQFSDKSGAVAGHTYLQFVRERQNNPLYSGKKIKIEYSLSPAMVAYRITDEGKGFDHRSYMALSPDNVNRELLMHGRGLIIARNTFDLMTFNEKGNQILLVKYFHGPSGEEPQF